MLLAFVVVIRGGWLPRSGSRWAPDSSAVPWVFTASSTPVTAIIFAIIYKSNISIQMMMYTATSMLFLSMVEMFGTAYMIAKFGFQGTRELRIRRWQLGWALPWKIGGYELTDLAKFNQPVRSPDGKPLGLNRSHQELFVYSGCDVRKVFTAKSIAAVYLATQIFYLLFVVCGPLALGCAAVILRSQPKIYRNGYPLTVAALG